MVWYLAQIFDILYSEILSDKFFVISNKIYNFDDGNSKNFNFGPDGCVINIKYNIHKTNKKSAVSKDTFTYVYITAH